VKRGKAANLAEAVDNLVEAARLAEKRRKLEDATATYYASLSGKALREEKELELTVGRAASLVDFDGE
jgi:hypothetical protein